MLDHGAEAHGPQGKNSEGHLASAWKRVKGQSANLRKKDKRCKALHQIERGAEGKSSPEAREKSG